MIEWLTNIDNLAVLAASIVAIASALVKILDAVSDVHPSETLDEYASTGRRWVQKAKKFLDKLGLNSR